MSAPAPPQIYYFNDSALEKGTEIGLIGNRGRVFTYVEALDFIYSYPETWHAIFRDALLQNNPFGNFIEFPLLTAKKLANEPFKLAIIGTNDFIRAGRPTPKTFSKAPNYYVSADILATDNLSRDALLLMPDPVTYRWENYGHITTFMTTCKNPTLISKFWKAFVDELKEAIKNVGTVWVSTHGLGVNWLHIRYSTQPKYYCSGYQHQRITLKQRANT